MSDRMTLEEVLELLQIVQKPDLVWFEVRSADLEIVIAKDSDVVDRYRSSALLGKVPTSSAIPVRMSTESALRGDLTADIAPPEADEAKSEASGLSAGSKISGANKQESSITNRVQSVNEKFGVDRVAVRAPMLGTFYRAPDPNSAPFIEVGSRVTESSTVGLVEAMKVFVSVTAGVSGVIEEILAENGQLVGYDDALAVVHPD